MAKIPIILEPGRADGKLIKTNSVYDDNQEKFLSDIVNNNKIDIEKLSEQRISYVSPCFANCADTHEDKLQSITLAPTNIAVKRIFSI